MNIREHVGIVNGDSGLGDYESYSIGRILGTGGSAKVYEVVRSGRRYAMKVPITVDVDGSDTCYPDYDRHLLDEYMSEAGVWADLSEKVPEAVVRLIDYNTTPFVWAVMEEADHDLESSMSGGSFDVSEMVQMLRSLQSVHDAGIVHRDLKPQNILNVGGVWKFGDFGLSKRMDRLSVTSPGRGTPYYLAPEQVDTRLGPTDRRTDVWQMGMVLYRAVTGRMPYAGTDRNAIMFSILNEGPDLTHVPQRYMRVVSKALARRKEDRYQTASEFADALSSAIGLCDSAFAGGMSYYKGLGSVPDYGRAYSLFSSGSDVGSVCMAAIMEHDGDGTDKDEISARSRVRGLGGKLSELGSDGDSLWIRAKLLKYGLVPADPGETVRSLLVRACEAGSVLAPDSLYTEDREADNPWLEASAKAGYAPAMSTMGVACDHGYGRPRSVEEAFEWFHRAVKQGYPSACNSIAVMYLDEDPSGTKAKEWVDRAMSMGSRDAHNTLGYMYLHGTGVPQSYARAAAEFAKGAELGSIDAKYDLGYMYENGLGVDRSYEKAADLYTEAMAGGCDNAFFALSMLYRDGRGVERSGKMAFDLCKDAADRGVDAAKLALSIHYVDGTYVSRDLAKAMELMEEVAEHGDADLQKYVGDLHMKGEITERAPHKAYRWYKAASDSGDADAKYEIGRMYENGDYLRPSLDDAVRMYREAADAGSDDAVAALCRLGRTVKRR